MKSILQDYEEQRECFYCGNTQNLEDHHIFGAANRKISEKYGLKVLLCIKHHTDTKEGVHGENKALRIALKQLAQQEFEKVYTRDMFIRIFGRNYLD